MSILDAFRSTHPQTYQHIIQHPAIMERPPLPATFLAAEALDDSCAARMPVDIVRAINNDAVYYNDWEE